MSTDAGSGFDNQAAGRDAGDELLEEETRHVGDDTLEEEERERRQSQENVNDAF